jgi:YegS/Rv2252/BmrU family lipid kinase
MARPSRSGCSGKELITVIINPISGDPRRGGIRDRIALAQSALASAGAEASIVVSERRGHVRELAAAAVRSGSRLVMVWGGDGSVNEAGSALMGGDVPLAIVPAGSGNGLARELGMPLQPAAAIAAGLHATPRTIDAGELAGRPFFNVAGVGVDAQIASRFDRAGRRGLASYVRVSVREALTYRSKTYRIDCGEISGGSGTAALPRRALLVTIANSPQFGNGARIAPAARLDDGRLDLVIFEEFSRLATLWALPRLFTGSVEGVRGLTSRQIERARIESDAPMTFHVDGEPVDGGTSLEIRVLPRALRICAVQTPR